MNEEKETGSAPKRAPRARKAEGSSFQSETARAPRRPRTESSSADFRRNTQRGTSSRSPRQGQGSSTYERRERSSSYSDRPRGSFDSSRRDSSRLDERPSRGGFRSDERPSRGGFRSDERPSRGGFRSGERPSRGGFRSGERPSRGGFRSEERPTFAWGFRDKEIHVPAGVRRDRKVVGRGQGSGFGKTARRGMNGQNARSGGGVRPGFEGGQLPLYRRLPRRGFSNARHQDDWAIVNIHELEESFEDGAEVNRESLLEHGLIRKKDRLVKILGDGVLTKKFHIHIHALSRRAQEVIEEAGGHVELIHREHLDD